MGEEKYDEAEKHFMAQIEHSFTDMVTALGLAYISLRRQDESKFLKYHQMALDLKMDKVHPNSLVRLGQLYLNFDRHHEAIDIFKKAISVGHDDLELRSLMACACYKAKLYADAAEQYRVILEGNPNSPEILNDLANCCFNMEQYDQAEKYYARVLEAKKVPVVTYLNYGLTTARLNKPMEAITALEQYIELEPNQPAIWRILGDLHTRTGNFESAIVYFERCLKENSSDPVTLFGLSDCYLHMGHRDSAILGYRRILDLDPNFAPARQRLEQCEQTATGSGKVTPVAG
jgi:tetratricopeptide (TPR) repeat protein